MQSEILDISSCSIVLKFISWRKSHKSNTWELGFLSVLGRPKAENRKMKFFENYEENCLTLYTQFDFLNSFFTSFWVYDCNGSISGAFLGMYRASQTLEKHKFQNGCSNLLTKEVRYDTWWECILLSRICLNDFPQTCSLYDHPLRDFPKISETSSNPRE